MKFFTCFFGLLCVLEVKCSPLPVVSSIDPIANIEPYNDAVIQAILQSAFLQTTGVLYQFGTEILEPLKEMVDILTKSMEIMAERGIPSKIGKAYLNALETGNKVKNALLLTDSFLDTPTANTYEPKTQETFPGFTSASKTDLANKIIDNILNH